MLIYVISIDVMHHAEKNYWLVEIFSKSQIKKKTFSKPYHSLLYQHNASGQALIKQMRNSTVN